ncbi:MAG: glycosyltransferase, partial [Bacteroidota bacterium]
MEKTSSSSPKISVLLPVRNEAANIVALLEDLEKQDLAPEHYEVLVLDDDSEDATKALAAAFVASFALRIVRIENPLRISPKKNAISQ